MRRLQSPLLAAVPACASLVLAAGAVIAIPREGLAQDAVQVAPQNYTVLLDNERVRVLDFRSKPGEETPMHSHPDYLVYDVQPGTMKITLANGKSITDEGEEPGDVNYFKARRHMTENVGETEVHALIIELKDPHKRGK